MQKEHKVGDEEQVSTWYDARLTKGDPLHDLRMKFENELLQVKNDMILVKYENLNLKSKLLDLEEEMRKFKAKHSELLDERDKNRLLRNHIPFAFLPEKKIETK